MLDGMSDKSEAALQAAREERAAILAEAGMSREELERRYEADALSEPERIVLGRLRELDWATDQ